MNPSIWSKLLQCLNDNQVIALVLWTAGVGVVGIATDSGSFVRWIMQERIDRLNDRIRDLEGEITRTSRTATSMSEGYSFKHLAAAVFITGLFAMALTGGGLFLYYTPRLHSVDEQLTKDRLLLRPLRSIFADDVIQKWPSANDPRFVQSYEGLLSSPIFLLDASGVTYGVGVSGKDSQRLHVSIKADRAQIGHTSMQKPMNGKGLGDSGASQAPRTAEP